MGNRLTKIYTRTGDDGSTGLGDGARVPKDSLRVEAYGSVDETNCAIGVLLALPNLPAEVKHCLVDVQHDLFDLGGELCIPGHRIVTPAYILRLEAKLDEFNETLPPLKDFILPGGGPGAAACHVARAVCRAPQLVLGTCRGGRARRSAVPESAVGSFVRHRAFACAP
jgi:cob(I)alamin adenosyltransferase